MSRTGGFGHVHCDGGGGRDEMSCAARAEHFGIPCAMADPMVACAKHPRITRDIGQVLGPLVTLGYHPRIPRTATGPVVARTDHPAVTRAAAVPWIPKAVVRSAVARADYSWIPRAATGPVVACTESRGHLRRGCSLDPQGRGAFCGRLRGSSLDPPHCDWSRGRSRKSCGPCAAAGHAVHPPSRTCRTRPTSLMRGTRGRWRRQRDY